MSWTFWTLISMLIFNMIQNLFQGAKFLLAIVIFTLQGSGGQILGHGMVNMLVGLQMEPRINHLLAIHAFEGFQIMVNCFQVFFLGLHIRQFGMAYRAFDPLMFRNCRGHRGRCFSMVFLHMQSQMCLWRTYDRARLAFYPGGIWSTINKERIINWR